MKTHLIYVSLPTNTDHFTNYFQIFVMAKFTQRAIQWELFLFIVYFLFIPLSFIFFMVFAQVWFFSEPDKHSTNVIYDELKI